MYYKFLIILLALLTNISHAVNLGCSEEQLQEKNKGLKNFAMKVEKARVCHIDSDCTTHEFYKLGNGCQTFESAINKTKINSLIKNHKAIPFCSSGIIYQCLYYIFEKDKVICKNKLCTVTYKDPQPPKFIFDPEPN